MTPILFALVAVAGGLGAAARLVLDGAISTRTGRMRRARGLSAADGVRWALPWGTILINSSGSLMLGLFVGLASAQLLDERAVLIAGTGFLGGYTTFSTASYETVRLLQQGGVAGFAALVNGFGVVVVGTAAAGLGIWAGTGLFP
ncbi:fluoride efflux transporter FluC [Leucobacter sp. GX24907]